MKKAELIKNMANDAGISKKQAKAAVDSFIKSVTLALQKGEKKFTLVGFGTWKTVIREERQGRNPQTGESMTISSRNAVVFRPGKNLKEKVQ